ncbi:hypothetical protein L4513_001913 [Pseudomonas aeruginosa]|nr:hypothetical protein [Pseudomonas aeruginosa]
MTNANECTCPSGDGSLRHPCPAHPASVELAGVAAKLTFINGRPAMCGCQVEYSSGGGEYSDVIDVTLCAKHSGSAILDLVATNRIALTPEYEGQWHADLYLDREIPLAKAEGATPAEAVLALMSAERIDPEQESVEQAGGDERVIGWRERILAAHPNSDPGFWTDALLVEHMAAEIADLRAALAQPSPDAPYADGIAADLERSNWTPEEALRWYAQGNHFDAVGGRTRIIDTGAIASNALKHLSLTYLEMKGDAELTEMREANAQPSPAQAEKAEAERPEMSPERAAYFMRRFKSEEKLLGPNEQAAVDYVLSLLAQHDRIVGALRAENAKLSEALDRWPLIRDSLKLRLADALARVAELETALEPFAAVADAYDDSEDDDHEPYTDMGCDDSLRLTLGQHRAGRIALEGRTPQAQAQHSVPEVSGIGRDFAYPRSVVLYLRTEPTDDDLRAIHDGLRSLAAAPDKEGL